MKSLELESRAVQYARKKTIEVDLDDSLGDGTDGNVWNTNRNSAIKVLQLEKNYLRERRCYQRLREAGVERIEGLAVPKLVDFDDELLVVEMEIVQPPYLLDFGKAYVDELPPFTTEELLVYESSLTQYFPSRDLPKVKKVCRYLRQLGIIYLDAKPNNIRIRSDEDERAVTDDEWNQEPPIDYPNEQMEE